MALDLWFREDVARILVATQETMRNSMGAVSPVDAEVGAAYQRGFVDALRAVAIAFGVVPLVGSGAAPRAARGRTVYGWDAEASRPCSGSQDVQVWT
jgi:hypothetical protein